MPGDYTTQSNASSEEVVEVPRPAKQVGVAPNHLTDHFKQNNLKRGVLIPLKTTQEVRQDHTIVQALITRVPTKSANDVIT